MSKSEARILRRLARAKEREARKMLLSKDPAHLAAARTLLQQVRTLRNSADVEDRMG